MPPPAKPPKSNAQTVQWRNWKGLNLTDARIAIEDEELYWNENALTVGKGAIQIVPGAGSSIATVAAGPKSIWGFVLNGTPVLMTINADGSATQVTLAGAQTAAAAVATFTPPADLTIWQTTPILLLDSVNGLYSWNGTTLLRHGPTVARTGDTTAGSPIVINVSTTTVGLAAGMPITGAGIPAATTILTVDSATQITLSANATANGVAVALTITTGAPATGIAIAVFEGRVWIAQNSRTIYYSAPNSYSDFTVGNGGGSFVITDDAFVGNIVHLVSAVEQLWPFSAASVEAVANVQASGSSPSVVTTFSITNILDALGALAPHSVRPYFRALAFLSASGVYALSGVTPQKLSDKLDGLFEAVTLNAYNDAPAAIAVVRSLTLLCFLVNITPSVDPSLPTPASGVRTVAPFLLCFTQGKWFVAKQGTPTWITTLVVSGKQQAWATDGSTIYQLFGAASTTAVTYKIQSKLFDFGASVNEKQALKVGLEVQAPGLVAPTFSVDNENSQVVANMSLTNELTFVCAGAIVWVGAGVIHWITTGLVLGRSDTTQWGHYLGWTLSGTDPPYRIQAVQMEIEPSREWSTP